MVGNSSHGKEYALFLGFKFDCDNLRCTSSTQGTGLLDLQRPSKGSTSQLAVSPSVVGFLFALRFPPSRHLPVPPFISLLLSLWAAVRVGWICLCSRIRSVAFHLVHAPVW